METKLSSEGANVDNSPQNLEKLDPILHKLFHICTKSKTAFCQKCGLVRVRLGTDRKGNKYWYCNRRQKGKADRKKEKHRQAKKGFCEICGFIPVHSRQLDIHHRDGNHYNDSVENMQTVCHNCHRLFHIKTYDELDEERMAGLLQRRWSVLLGFDNQPDTIIESGHKNTKKYSHKLTNICFKSKTGYCERCGLVSLIIRTDKQGCQYWQCNHGGKKQSYGKNGSKRGKLQKFFRENKKSYCEECGFISAHERQLDIHHKDHNHKNNHINNLATICHNCHRLEHLETQEEIDLKRELSVLTDRWAVLLKN